MDDQRWFRRVEGLAVALLLLQFLLVVFGDRGLFEFRAAFAALLVALVVLWIQVVRRRDVVLAELLTRERSARAEADVANHAKDDFFCTVSHELRGPLSAIVGWLHLLQSGKLDGAATRRALDTIERNATSQASLITDMFEISGIIGGKIRLDVRTLDLQAIIEHAVESARPTADAKDIHIETLLAPCAPAQGDPARLGQVVQNLLANAIKFTPRGGRILLSLTGDEMQATFSIKDSGQGIEPALLPFVFDRFRQANGTRSRRGGLGLGLAIVRHMVELHGGTVRAESDGDTRGAEFIVTLPLARTGKARASSTLALPLGPLPLLSYPVASAA